MVRQLVQRVRNLVLRKRPPLTNLDKTLVDQRNLIRGVLGEQWVQAVLLSAGRLALDYLCLLAALRATGSHPRPSLILVAYAVAGIVGMIPITPGGLGIVEASLTGLLVLAGVSSSSRCACHAHVPACLYWVPRRWADRLRSFQTPVSESIRRTLPRTPATPPPAAV